MLGAGTKGEFSFSILFPLLNRPSFSFSLSLLKRVPLPLDQQGQLRYMLGDGGRGWSRGKSFLVGHGREFPQQPHQRAASCPPPPATCNYLQLHSKDPNPNVLVGALVGGPFFNDSFPDDRMDYAKSEVVRREFPSPLFHFRFRRRKKKKAHLGFYLGRKKNNQTNRESSTTQGSPPRSPEPPSSPRITPGAAACRLVGCPTGRSPLCGTAGGEEGRGRVGAVREGRERKIKRNKYDDNKNTY